MVLRHQHFGFITPAHNRFVDVFGPRQRLTNFGPAQGVGVVQGVGNIFRGFNQFLLFDVPQHLRRCFGTRGQHEVIGQAVDDLFLSIFLYDICWRNQGNGSRGGRGSQSRADLAFGIRF